MNLMFWKKKAAIEEGAEAPVKSGFYSQIKSRLAALFQRFKKAPPEVAEEQDKDTPTHAGEKTAIPEENPAENLAKPGLLARIKSGFTALSQRFKKSPAPTEAAPREEQSKDTQSGSKDKAVDAEEEPEKPGLGERIKSEFVPFALQYKIYLFSVLAILLLIGIVYAAWDIIFPPLVRNTTSSDPAKYLKPQAPEPAVEPGLVIASQPVASQPVVPQTEAEILKKKSEDAQARAEALMKESIEAQAQAEALKIKSEEAQAQAEAEAIKKKEDEERAKALKKARVQQQPLGSSAQQASGNANPSPVNGEMSVGNKDPKATATTLKEAIEAMNASSGGYNKKPAKE